MAKGRGSTLKEWGKAVGIAFVLLLAVRTFLVDVFPVQGTSMEKTVLSGDFVVVNKLAYGPRLPLTLLSLPFTHQTLPFAENARSYLPWPQLPYCRLPGFSEVQRGGIAVFNCPAERLHPVDQRSYFIKRCAALPGDTVRVAFKQVLVNGKETANPAGLQFAHHVKTDSSGLHPDSLRALGATEGGPVSNQFDYHLTLTRAAACEMARWKNVQHVVELEELKGVANDFIFPENERYPWNRDHFGPVVVPKAGDSVRLTAQNLPLYLYLIEEHEGHEVSAEGSRLLVDGEPVEHYVFEMDYYFMLGDSRHNAEDSRHWGFVPENHIVGRAGLILFSVEKGEAGGMRWSRCFSGIE